MFGEDVGRKGGVYGVTRGLQKRSARPGCSTPCWTSSRSSGLALGAGVAGLLPIPEIQYLAYLHNAEDQLRGEAATLQFFSPGSTATRWWCGSPATATRSGFGGHFHNDNAIGVLRDIPGLVIASPARPDDAAAMLRTCAAAAEVDGHVCVFLEPIALYHGAICTTRGTTGGWPVRTRDVPVPIGRARTLRRRTELTIVTFGNGVPMSLRVAARLAPGIRVLDLRWLAPLPGRRLLREANQTGRVLVVGRDPAVRRCLRGVVAALVDHGFTGRMARVTSQDSYVPLGDAADHVLLSERTSRPPPAASW